MGRYIFTGQAATLTYGSGTVPYAPDPAANFAYATSDLNQDTAWREWSYYSEEGATLAATSNVGSDPDGGSRANLITRTGSGAVIWYQRLGSLPPGDWTAQVRLKATGADIGKEVKLTLQRPIALSPTSSVTVTLTGSWQLATLTHTLPAYSGGTPMHANNHALDIGLSFPNTAGNGAVAVQVYGLKLNRGTSATSYAYPTEAMARTWSQPLPTAVPPLHDFLHGVTIAGTEFGTGTRDGGHADLVSFFDYIWPRPVELDYFQGKGFNLVRVPLVPWRLLTEDYYWRRSIEELDWLIDECATRGMTVHLDCHDKGRAMCQRYGLIGVDAYATAEYTTFFGMLAERYKSKPNIIYGLCSEPTDMSIPVWFAAAQELIDAIRSAGGGQLISMQGGSYGEAAQWVSNGSAALFLTMVDPIDNLIVDFHQYFDPTNEGWPDNPVQVGAGTRATPAYQWLKATGERAIHTEWGGNGDSAYLTELNTHANLMADASGWLIGHTWWAAGISWGPGYGFNLQPDDLAVPVDKPQLPSVQIVLPAAPDITAVVINDTTPEVGDVLSFSLTASGVPRRPTAVAWKAAGVTVGTGLTYTVASADLGKAITVTVTVTNEHGSDTLTSAATSAVIAPPLAFLFASGEKGVWYDIRPAYLWTDSSRTVHPAVGQEVGCVDDRSGNGNHLGVANSWERPILRETSTGSGKYYLEFNPGTEADNYMFTTTKPWGNTITSAHVCIAYKEVSRTNSMIVSLNHSVASGECWFAWAPRDDTDELDFNVGTDQAVGSKIRVAWTPAVGANVVLTLQDDATQVARVNGTQVGSNAAGHDIPAPGGLYIGWLLWEPLRTKLYGFVAVDGMSDSERTTTEAYMTGLF